MFIFFVFCKNGLIKSCLSSKDVSEYKISWPYVEWCMFCIPQEYECMQFWNGCSYSITNYGVEVTFNDMTSLLNFIKSYLLVQKLMGGDKQTHKQDGHLYTFPLGRKVC
jgi:hypothetical protein